MSRLRISSFYPDVRLGNFAALQRINQIALAEPIAMHAATTREFLHGGRTEDNPPGEGHWENLCARSAKIRAAGAAP